MKKLVLISLVIAAVVAFSASNAMAYRYFGGSYTILSGGMYGSGAPWNGDSGSGPHPYTAVSGSALSDGVVTIAETQQLMSVNPAQVDFADVPGDKKFPGDTDMWWGTMGSDRFDAFLIDLGQPVEIDAIAGVLNKRHAGSINMQWFRIKGSNDGVNFVDIIMEEPYPDNGYNKYTGVAVRPSTRPIGLFLNGGGYDISNYTLDTVTYRYIKVAISHNGDGDSTGLSEFVIDAVPEPATILMLVGGGLFGLLRRKS
jgi:hypothetical protein